MRVRACLWERCVIEIKNQTCCEYRKVDSLGLGGLDEWVSDCMSEWKGDG